MLISIILKPVEMRDPLRDCLRGPVPDRERRAVPDGQRAAVLNSPGKLSTHQRLKVEEIR